MVKVSNNICDICGRGAVRHLRFSYDKHMDVSGSGWDYDWFYIDLCNEHNISEDEYDIWHMTLGDRYRLMVRIKSMIGGN